MSDTKRAITIEQFKNCKVPVTIEMLAPMMEMMVEAMQRRDLKIMNLASTQRGLVQRIDRQAQLISALTKQLAALERKAAG